MTRRIHVCPVDGSGTEEDPYRARVFGCDHSTLGISHLVGFAVCVVDADDHSPFDADPAIDSLPPVALTTRLASLTATQRQRLGRMATRRGVVIGDAEDLREVVRRLSSRADLRLGV
jgi:hypothetical protein